MNTISKNLNTMLSSIADIATRSGRRPGDVRLVAVGKTYDAAILMNAYAAGQCIFGENRIQELVEKRDRLPADIEWHMIGHLQTNKVRFAVGSCHLIHSVDTLKLAAKIDEIAGSRNVDQDILIQVNVSGEASKFGISVDDVPGLLDNLLSLVHVRCCGFMTMAPFNEKSDVIRAIFSRLRRSRDDMETRYHLRFPELSMGMSGDYPIAIEEGATLVRIGTAIFGQRAG